MAERKQTRVLFLFAYLHKGGMQRAVSNISMALPDCFEQYVAFFSTENPGFEYKATLCNLEIPGPDSRRFFGRFTRTIRRTISRVMPLADFIAKHQIDVVVSMGEAANIYSLLSRHKAKRIITSRVAHARASYSNSQFVWLYPFLRSSLYRNADLIIAVSHALGDEMRKVVADKVPVRVIPNLYPNENILHLSRQSLPSDFSFLEEKPFLLSVGTLCHQKAQDQLLEIFAPLARRFDELHLVIVGAGEAKDALVEQASRLGVSQRVAWVDYDENPYRYMARASAFVLTSRTEGFPNVLVEAMICGAPVFAFDCPTGPDEILEGGKWGVLVRDRSQVEMVERLSAVLEDDVLWQNLSARARERAELYSQERIIDQWVDVLWQCVVMNPV